MSLPHPNTIKAMSELMTLKVPRHDDPSSSFKRLEKIFSEFFPNAETVKLAAMFQMLDEQKYKAIQELFEMPEGPLKSLYMTAFQVECQNLAQQSVYEWSVIPPDRKLTGSRAIFQLKWDKISRCSARIAHSILNGMNGA